MKLKKWLNDDPIENFEIFKKKQYDKKIEVMKNKIAIQIKKNLTLKKMTSFLKFLHYKNMFTRNKQRIISASQAILEATDQFKKRW